MPKYLLVLLVPFVLAAVVLVAPFALIYFLFDRLCDLIEEFKPAKGRRKGSKKENRAQQLSRLVSLIPNRGNHDTQGQPKPAQPALSRI